MVRITMKNLRFNHLLALALATFATACSITDTQPPPARRTVRNEPVAVDCRKSRRAVTRWRLAIANHCGCERHERATGTERTIAFGNRREWNADRLWGVICTYSRDGKQRPRGLYLHRSDGCRRRDSEPRNSRDTNRNRCVSARSAGRLDSVGSARHNRDKSDTAVHVRTNQPGSVYRCTV